MGIFQCFKLNNKNSCRFADFIHCCRVWRIWRRRGTDSNALLDLLCGLTVTFLPLLYVVLIRVLTKGLVNRIVSLNNCPDPDVSISSGSGLKELSRQGYGTEGNTIYKPPPDIRVINK